MERKSAQKGSRSADARSPDRSDKARRDGARFKKSGSFKSDKKHGTGSGKFKKKGGPSDGWSPSVDARKETREERALRVEGGKPERGQSERNDRSRGRSRDGKDHKGRSFRNRPDSGANKGPRDFKKRDHQSDKADGAAKAEPNKAKGPAYTPPTRALEEGERIAKIMARAGLCSRRDAEEWIRKGRVKVNGNVLESPAINVHPHDKVLVDGEPLPVRERTRLWLYHKPRGLVTTTSDPEGRTTVFEKLPEGLPRVITVGRLDINTEGLLLLTNDGGLARVLELPSTGWLRRYRVRAYGRITQEQLDTLADGIALDGVLYGSIDAHLEREQGDNVWITVALREGKNREVKKVLGHLGLDVNRLIRVSYGPFQLLDLEEGKVNEIRSRVLRDQLGEKLVLEAGADFDAPVLTETSNEPSKDKKSGKDNERKSSGGAKGGYLSAKEGARAVADQNDRKGGRKSFGDRDDDRGERRERESYNRIPYAERKPYDPTAPRRTSFTFREDGADGKKSQGKTSRRVGGRPQKADLMDPNARIEKPKRQAKPGNRGGGRPGTKGGFGPKGGKPDARNERGGPNRGGPNRGGPNRGGPNRGGPKVPRGPLS